MKLKLNGIEVECVIGDLPDERGRLQKLVVDLELEIPDTAAHTDALEDTVDYAALSDAVRRTLVEAKCRMIERAAYLVAKTAAGDPGVRSVEARVTKSGAVPSLASATAVYRLEN